MPVPQMLEKYAYPYPTSPTYQLFGLEKGDAGGQCSVKGLPSPDGFGSFRGARRSTRVRKEINLKREPEKEVS